jgi:hypothetical protein
VPVPLVIGEALIGSLGEGGTAGTLQQGALIRRAAISAQMSECDYADPIVDHAHPLDVGRTAGL